MPGPEFTAAAMNHGSETCSSTDSEPESEPEHTATDAGLGVFPNAKKGDGSRPAVVLVLLTAVFVFNQADRQLYSVLLPSGMRCDPAHNITTECIALDRCVKDMSAVCNVTHFWRLAIPYLTFASDDCLHTTGTAASTARSRVFCLGRYSPSL